MSVHQATYLSRMEEEYQLKQWGLVEGGHDMDRLNNAVNLSSVSLFWSLHHYRGVMIGERGSERGGEGGSEIGSEIGSIIGHK